DCDGVREVKDHLIIVCGPAAAAFDSHVASEWQVDVEWSGAAVDLSGDDLRRYGGRRDKRIPHRFRDALRGVRVAAAIITASADVEVLSGWQVQTCQGPVAASRRAVAQRSVVHIVG